MICESFAKDADGKVSLHGEFTRIEALQFPAKYTGPMVVWTRLGLDAGDIGRQFTLTVRFEDAERHPLSETTGPVTVPHTTTRNAWFDISNKITDLILPVPGDYAFVCLLDGQEMGRALLTVEKSQP